MLLGYLFDHGVDFQRRVINLTGEINEDMFKLLDAALAEMEAGSKSSVTIKINSPGGEVYQAMAIVGRLRESKCNIVTMGYGAVMSAATLILACGDKRKISKYSWFMNHEMGYELGETRHSQAKAYVAQADKEEKTWVQWMAEFTKKSAKFWLDNGVGIDAYFSAEQLVDLGVVDELF
jgi:ATP-dependent Clp protease protease subunit